MEERYIASIDLGTSKLGLCVARVKGDDVQVVYYKETPYKTVDVRFDGQIICRNK